ncbi:RNA polymerase sigma factor [Peristeroidobacter soli]|uniref:RNA polymerase sigma factor n=1 Tax=Peristeroidobacter soli TaxID=2497877 RepID=UPI00101D82BD|nr:sigma-70 family RNA polymerase sigma factor [Peristeroidobacter soli]
MPTSPDPTPELGHNTEPSPASASQDRAKLIEQLFRDHNRALITFLVTRLNSEAEAREVAQEAYVRLLQLERPDAIGFHRAYLFRIATNLAMDRLRHRTVRAKAPTRELFAEWFQRRSPEQEALDAAEQVTLTSALAELPEKMREALTRHFLTGESVATIAAEWGLTDRMVRYYLARALAHCRARLDEEGTSS